MPTCFNSTCSNEALADFPYCETCNEERLPSKRALTENGVHTVEYMQKRLHAMAVTAPSSTPTPIPPSDFEKYQSLSFEQLKQKEQEASDWLLSNTSSPVWKDAKLRYNTLVKVLNMKTGVF